AMDQARFQVHDPVGVLEVARQAGIGTLQHARAHAQIAFLERNIGRTLRLLPQLLAAELEQLDRAALGDHLLVLLDFLLCVLCGGRQGDDQQNAGKAQHQATTPSILLVSPLLSSQPTSILSPLAPPLMRNENTGLRDTAWLISLSITVLPFCFTLMFWMKCSAWPLCAVVMGWVISTRISVVPPAPAVVPPTSVARIFMGPAISASAASDSDFDLAAGAVVPAAGRGDHPDVGGLGHLHVQLHEGQRALLEVELRRQRKGILLQHHRERAGAGNAARDL